jgi:arylsulfatase A-like enzyme
MKKSTSIIAAASICLLTSCQNSNKQESKSVKPNILFILADDFGYHDLSCMGSNYYETPNIDRIAAEGMIFTDGYATCQVCSPSRASIMSGKFPARHGITDWIGARTGEDWRKLGRFNKLLPADNGDHLPHEYITLPEALKDNGYKTFFAGKWHLGREGSYPEDHGFDINQGGFEQGGPYTGGYFSPFNNPKMTDYEDEIGMSLPMKLAKKTGLFIKENKDTSFFAFLSFYAVHSPIQTTKEKWAKYRQKAEDMGITEKGFEMAHFLPMRQEQDNPVYAGLVEMMDDAVGHVLQVLNELGLDENTIVIFTSDNGGVSAGDHFATSNLPLRGGKGYQFEGGIREPYFIKVPWLEIAGKKSEVPVTGTDFYPTLLELAGAKLLPEEHNDGVSLVPLLTGGTLPERPLIWHYPHYGNQGGEPSSIIRLGDWKLIHYYEDGREDLYNLKTDLEETTDISAEYPELTKQLSEQLFAYLNEVGARFPEKDPEYNEELEKKRLERVRTELMPRLEKQRLEFLSKNFDPGNNWWGSEISFDEN